MDPIFVDSNVMALLKTVYHDGVESDMQRNSPVLQMWSKRRVEGKDYAWPAIYAASPAASSDYLVVAELASQNPGNVQWKATPGRLFSGLTISPKELVASRTNEGGFMQIFGNKVFGSLESFRRQLAKVIYGTGKGEIGVYPTTAWDGTTNSPVSLATAASGQIGSDGNPATGALITGLDTSVTIAMVPNQRFRFLSGGLNGTVTPALGSPALVADIVDEHSILLKGVTASTTINPGDVLIFEGSQDAATSKWTLPVGLPGWLLDRNDAAYQTNLTTPFYDVFRKKAPHQLGGKFYAQATGEKKLDAVMKLLNKCRTGGGVPDMIIMNDVAAAEAIAEYEAQRTMFLSADQKASKSVVMRGAGSANFALWTSIIDKIVDDPYCPYEDFYILEQKAVELLVYTNLERITRGANATNEPGRADPMTENKTDTIVTNGDTILLDDIISIEDGTRTSDGAVKLVGFNLYFSFVLWNTGGSGHGKFIR